MMKVLQYEIRFTAPAFLGNAEQSGQWRTPPLKALLRQWWRVVYATDCGFEVDVTAMRSKEARLFGAAADNGDSSRSRVRIRLDRWTLGQITEWPGPDPKVRHPEVDVADKMIGSQLYLGYGPLVIKKGTALKKNAAIQADESASVSLAFPDEQAVAIGRALAMIHLYGSFGGRSRNGWGSFVLDPRDGTPPLAVDGKAPQRPWRDALKVDWPHAIGADERGPLIWRTEALDDWKAVMRQLAATKIGLRTQFRPGERGAVAPEERHWLSYPVTNHSVKSWGNFRLPNSLRFKLRQGERGKLYGVIFHVPCRPPAEFRPESRMLESVWQRAHAFLDAPTQKLSRIPA